MAISTLLTEALGRALDPEEQEMLTFLSPQGMAKLNTDLCKGMDLSQTLSEMQRVFQTMKKRRMQIESAVPEAAQAIFSKMSRPPSTDELVLLADCPPATLYGKINRQLQAGEVLDDILQDLALEHRQKQLMFDAQRLANTQGKAVSISRLAPTIVAGVPPPLKIDAGDGEASPTSSVTQLISAGGGSNGVTLNGRTRIRVGLSPIVTWFDETTPRTPQFSPVDLGPSLTSPVITATRGPTSSAASTPRSCLRSSTTPRFPRLSSTQVTASSPSSTSIGPEREDGGGRVDTTSTFGPCGSSTLETLSNSFRSPQVSFVLEETPSNEKDAAALPQFDSFSGRETSPSRRRSLLGKESSASKGASRKTKKPYSMAAATTSTAAVATPPSTSCFYGLKLWGKGMAKTLADRWLHSSVKSSEKPSSPSSPTKHANRIQPTTTAPFSSSQSSECLTTECSPRLS